MIMHAQMQGSSIPHLLLVCSYVVVPTCIMSPHIVASLLRFKLWFITLQHGHLVEGMHVLKRGTNAPDRNFRGIMCNTAEQMLSITT